MNFILPIFSFALFLLAMYFRARENSITLFQKYNIQQKKKYSITIPIKEIKRAIDDAKDVRIRDELKRCLKNRMYFWYSLVLVFVIILLPYIMKGIMLAE